MILLPKLVVLMVLLVLSPFAEAQIYKWIDEQGRARYGEKPPPGVEARLLAPPPGASADRPRQSVDEQEAEFRRRQIQKREEEERHAQAARVRAQQCERLRDELSYTEQLRLFRWDRGEKVYFSDAERKAHADRVRALIAQHCG
jgi:hypothetical protein